MKSTFFFRERNHRIFCIGRDLKHHPLPTPWNHNSSLWITDHEALKVKHYPVLSSTDSLIQLSPALCLSPCCCYKINFMVASLKSWCPLICSHTSFIADNSLVHFLTCFIVFCSISHCPPQQTDKQHLLSLWCLTFRFQQN